MYARDIDIPFYSQTKKLRLVKPNPDYASITIKWISREEVTHYLGASFSGMTVDDEVSHLNNMVTDKDRYSWMIELDGRIVGNVEINELKKLTKRYGIKAGAFCTLIGDPNNWGQGLGACTKQVACNWAFKDSGFELIEAKSYVENDRSWKTLEKLGFHFDGIEDDELEGKVIKWKVYTLRKADWAKQSWSKR